MFVFTLKASGLKFFSVIALSVAILATAIGILPTISAAHDVASVTTDFKNISSEEDMVRFLSNFGIEVEPNATEIYEFTIPEKFNSVYEKYNDIQRAQGLNLKRYAGQDATAYIFKVKNSDSSGEVFATLFVRNGRVIAGDVSSKKGEGFVRGLQNG